jgi:hypothetical protein
MSDQGKAAAAWQAARLGIEVRPERATELAAQATAIGASLTRVASVARFEDEPATFLAALASAAGESGRRD